MTRVTLRTVNKALTAAGIKAELVRYNGEGGRYYYFIGDDVQLAYCPSIYTAHLTRYTVEQWVAFGLELKSEHINRVVRNDRVFANGQPVLFWEDEPNVVTLDGKYTADELEQLVFALRNPRKP